MRFPVALGARRREAFVQFVYHETIMESESAYD